MTAKQRERNKIRKKISDARRESIFKQDSYTCVFCGSRGPLSIDHVLAVKECLDSGYHHYSINHPLNLLTACFKCNTIRVLTPPKVMKYGRFTMNPMRLDRYLKLTKVAMKALNESLAVQGRNYADAHQ